jgi:hypothetical protein
MTYTDFQDMGAHLTKQGWDYARGMLEQGFNPAYAIKEAENFESALKIGVDTKEVIYDQKSA